MVKIYEPKTMTTMQRQDNLKANCANKMYHKEPIQKKLNLKDQYEMKVKLKGPHMQFFLKYSPNYSNNSQLEPSNKLTNSN